MGQLVSEERIVFGLVADGPSNYSLNDLVETYQYSYYDIATIAREVWKIYSYYDNPLMYCTC